MESKLYLDATIASYANSINKAGEALFSQIDPENVPVIIEVPKLCPNKYEMEKATGLLTLDRVLHSSIYYPGDYGYVPNTLCGDGDPIDAVLLTTYPLYPGVIVNCRVIGVMIMEDDKGEDCKLIMVVAKDPKYKHVTDVIEHVSEHTRRVICHFFETYKDLENKWSIVSGIKGRADGIAELEKSVKMYRDEPHHYPAVENELPPPDYTHMSIRPSKIPKLFKGVPKLDYPYRVSVFINIPCGGNNKYEYNSQLNTLEVDYVLRTHSFSPAEYGFIPQTIRAQGDCCRIIVIASYPLIPGSVCDVRIIGGFQQESEGVNEIKYIGTVHNDPRYLDVQTITDLAPDLLDDIQRFFEWYKMTYNTKDIEVKNFIPKEQAIQSLIEAHNRYLQNGAGTLVNFPRYDRMDIGFNNSETSTVNAIVTSPMGSSNIYRFDKTCGRLRLDRRLHSSMYFPANVGFIPQTVNESGDELSVVIIAMFGLVAGALIPCRVIGKLELQTNKGPDAQIVCVPEKEPRLRHMETIEDVPQHIKDEIFNFYANYKTLEDANSWNIVRGWTGKTEAETTLRRAHDRFYMYGLRMEEMENRITQESREKAVLQARVEELESRLKAIEDRQQQSRKQNEATFALIHPRDENEDDRNMEGHPSRIRGNLSNVSFMQQSVYNGNNSESARETDFQLSDIAQHPSLEIQIIDGLLEDDNRKFIITPLGLTNSQRRSSDKWVYIGASEQDGQNNTINDIVIPAFNQGIGEQHLAIRYSPNNRKYFMKDLGTGTGTFVKLESKFTLRGGYIISFGDSHMVAIINEDQRNNPEISLKFLEGPKAEEVFTFSPEESPIQIGRMPDCKIHFHENTLSRHQCRVTYENSEWKVEDGNGLKVSANGTWLFVDEKFWVYDGMKFKIGQTLLLAIVHDPRRV